MVFHDQAPYQAPLGGKVLDIAPVPAAPGLLLVGIPDPAQAPGNGQLNLAQAPQNNGNDAMRLVGENISYDESDAEEG